MVYDMSGLLFCERHPDDRAMRRRCTDGGISFVNLVLNFLVPILVPLSKTLSLLATLGDEDDHSGQVSVALLGPSQGLKVNML